MATESQTKIFSSDAIQHPLQESRIPFSKYELSEEHEPYIDESRASTIHLDTEGILSNQSQELCKNLDKYCPPKYEQPATGWIGSFLARIKGACYGWNNPHEVERLKFLLDDLQTKFNSIEKTERTEQENEIYSSKESNEDKFATLQKQLDLLNENYTQISSLMTKLNNTNDLLNSELEVEKQKFQTGKKLFIDKDMEELSKYFELNDEESELFFGSSPLLEKNS